MKVKSIAILVVSMLILSSSPAWAKKHEGRSRSGDPTWVKERKKGDNPRKSGDPNWVKDRKKDSYKSSKKNAPNWVKDSKKKDKGKDKNEPKWVKERKKEAKREFKEWNKQMRSDFKPAKGKKMSKGGPVFGPGPKPYHDNGNHYGWRKPPKRPHRPNNFMSPFSRPSRPHGWNPGSYRGPKLSSVLGVAFGVAISNALTRLLSGGYNVDGYENNMVFLRDVPFMNYAWPDATMYYNNGGLYGSNFYYSTPGRNMSRYNSVYNYLIRNYGQPINRYNQGGIIRASWFTGNNGFISLEFAGRQSQSGLRYYTTLSLGN